MVMLRVICLFAAGEFEERGRSQQRRWRSNSSCEHLRSRRWSKEYEKQQTSPATAGNYQSVKIICHLTKFSGLFRWFLFSFMLFSAR